MSIKEITKEDLSNLDRVVTYKNRTIGFLFVVNEVELIEKWEEAQFELGSKYQYQGDNKHIWDYYLAICCDFDEDNLGTEVRFKIESDRFCCRKTFLFNKNKDKFSIESAIETIFPTIISPKKITLLEPSELIKRMKTDLLKDDGFYTRVWDEEEIALLADTLISEASEDA